ncbi:MAG: anti-sigma factor antagonist, partial [Calditrichaeota bacterium]
MTEEHRLVESVEVTDTGIHIIQLKSVLDASTVDEFEQVLGFLITQNNYKFIVDLSRIDFISSAGWGVFIGELKKIRTHQGDIKLVGMQPDVYDVFLLLELDTLIEAFETLDDALISFGVEPAETAQESAGAALEGGADAAGISEEQAEPTEAGEDIKPV